MLRDEFENLIELGVHEPVERAAQRQRLQEQLLELETIRDEVGELNRLALEGATQKGMSASCSFMGQSLGV